MNGRPTPALAGIALTLLSLFSMPSLAATTEEVEPLDRKIDLDLADANVREVLTALASMLEAEPVLERTLEGRTVSIRLHNTRVRTALDAITDSLDAAWVLRAQIDGGKPRLEVSPRALSKLAPVQRSVRDALGERLSLDLATADLEEVLLTFARVLDAEADFDSQIGGGRVSIHLTNVTLREALDAVLGSSWSWRVEEGPKHRLLVVRPAGKS